MDKDTIYSKFEANKTVIQLLQDSNLDGYDFIILPTDQKGYTLRTDKLLTQKFDYLKIGWPGSNKQAL